MPSDSQPSGGGFGATLKAKWGPLPVWGWLAIMTAVALGAYLLLKHKSASATPTPTPSDVGQPGVVVINQGGPGVTPPGATPPPEPGNGGGSVRQITVEKNETLAELARSRKWTPETLSDVEQMNVIQGGGHLTPSSKLTEGQTILRPLGGS